MGGRETDDDDTHERHTDTNRLTKTHSQLAATHPEWAHNSEEIGKTKHFTVCSDWAARAVRFLVLKGLKRKKENRHSPREGWEDGLYIK